MMTTGFRIEFVAMAYICDPLIALCQLASSGCGPKSATISMLWPASGAGDRPPHARGRNLLGRVARHLAGREFSQRPGGGKNASVVTFPTAVAAAK
jgi:hypothetical protein